MKVKQTSNIPFAVRVNGSPVVESSEFIFTILDINICKIDQQNFLSPTQYIPRRAQWLRGLRRRFAAARLLRSWVRSPPGGWVLVCCECYVLSGRCLCDELNTRPEETYRLWCVVVCDLETSWTRRSWPTGGCCAKNKQTIHTTQTWEQP
jgi:hypothetical protein